MLAALRRARDAAEGHEAVLRQPPAADLDAAPAASRAAGSGTTRPAGSARWPSLTSFTFAGDAVLRVDLQRAGRSRAAGHHPGCVSSRFGGDTRRVRRYSRLLVLLLTASLATLVGCTTGSDAVDQAAGGEFRFVSGTPTGADHRGRGPQVRAAT